MLISNGIAALANEGALRYTPHVTTELLISGFPRETPFSTASLPQRSIVEAGGNYFSDPAEFIFQNPDGNLLRLDGVIIFHRESVGRGRFNSQTLFFEVAIAHEKLIHFILN